MVFQLLTPNSKKSIRHINVTHNGHAMQILFTTIAQGTSSGYQNADQLIIDTVGQWEQLWQEHTSDVIPPLKTPQIDFAKNLVIAIFSGEKPTSGYQVEIVSVETETMPDCDEARLIVQVNYGFPGLVAQDAITHPYHMIQLPQVSTLQGVKNIFFEKT